MMASGLTALAAVANVSRFDARSVRRPALTGRKEGRRRVRQSSSGIDLRTRQ
jgi:hypothetical protein